MLANTTAWLREECAYFGIPFVRINAQQAQSGVAGVCGHVDLGSDGGGHWDPGPNFPWDIVMSGQGPTPAPAKGTHMWALRDPDSGGTWQCDETGAVFAYDGAPYLGGANVYNPSNWPCSGFCDYEDRHGAGYLVTLDAGDAKPGGDRFPRYRFPRDGSAVKK
jgi:hypothetical protein